MQALTAGPVIALSLAFLLLFVSGFVSASEVAFFSLTPGDLNEIGEENRPADPVIKRLLERSEYLLASILIANNFVNVAVVMLCTYAINAWINFSAAPLLGFVLETILLTFLLLLFGEIMPKIYAQKNSLRFVERKVYGKHKSKHWFGYVEVPCFLWCFRKSECRYLCLSAYYEFRTNRSNIGWFTEIGRAHV